MTVLFPNIILGNEVLTHIPTVHGLQESINFINTAHLVSYITSQHFAVFTSIQHPSVWACTFNHYNL